MPEDQPGKPSRRIQRRLASPEEIAKLKYVYRDKTKTSFVRPLAGSCSFTAIVPTIKTPSDEEANAFPLPAIWAIDEGLLGFGENVNRAMAQVETPWALIWNDDATPRFEAEAFAEQLAKLPDQIKCAAPLKYVEPGQVLQRWHQESYVAESGSLASPDADWVRTHCFMTEFGPRWVAMIRRPDWKPDTYLEVAGTSYCPLYAVRTDWFHSLGGHSGLYSPGYLEDAHFWRLTRRMGGVTIVFRGFEYTHAGRGTFAKIYEDLGKHLDENVGRYLKVWGDAQ